MQKEVITLFSRIRLPKTPVSEIKTPRNYVSAFNTELASYGYTLDADLLMRLEALPERVFRQVRKDALAITAEVKGEANHSVLFNKFPYETPDQHDYLLRRIYGHVQNRDRHNIENPTLLSCGHVIDNDVFNLSDFGACPICQFQVDELSSSEEVRDAYKSVTPLTVLRYASDAFVQAEGNKMLARPSSLSKTERDFLTKATAEGIQFSAPTTTIFKENLPFIYAHVSSDVASHLSGATDIMRIAYFLSDEESDLSLKENVKFKITTGHKKKLLGFLNGLDNLEEDMMRNRERWLRLGEKLNPGTAENRRRFPRVAEAFDALRTDQKAIPTFSRKVEKSIRAKTVDEALLRNLSSRPGEFLRRLDFLLRTADDSAPVLEKLTTVVTQARTKMLFELRKYFDHRATSTSEPRMFIPKGAVNKMQVLEDRRAPVSLSDAGQVMDIIDAEVISRFSKALDPMGKVYLDEGLKGLVLPYNQRGDSGASTSAFSKGSRFPLSDKADVLRLFVHWTGNVDVDLSINLLDEDFETLESVGYYNTQSQKIIHSGDIQNAPNGASEFVDMDIRHLRSRGMRYAVMSVISFRGDGFNAFPCFAGFMERDSVKSGARFEASSVALKFDIKSDATTVMPLVFDIGTKEVIYVDLTTGQRSLYNARSGGKQFAALARAAISLPQRKPTAHDVLYLKARAVGELVNTAEEADLVFSRDNVDLNELVAELAQ